jgi:hypothetical protein
MSEQTYSVVTESYCEDEDHRLFVLIQFDCDPEKMKDLGYNDLLHAIKVIKPRIPIGPCPVCGGPLNDYGLACAWDEYVGYELIGDDGRWNTPPTSPPFSDMRAFHKELEDLTIFKNSSSPGVVFISRNKL